LLMMRCPPLSSSSKIEDMSHRHPPPKTCSRPQRRRSELIDCETAHPPRPQDKLMSKHALALDPATKADIRRRFLAVDTSNVSDVLDQMGVCNQGLSADFRPFPSTAPRLAGFAYTISGQMIPYEGTGDAAKMTACQGIGPDEVSVW